ncbi:putative thymine-7-hydroxylase [Leptomonas pyrrhocoris]|uniref:Putative thymine-7-hydroxylase n=1 Tax=Leptomonas pyrrhocoris TaxID=157538 RepID=A0A0N0DVF4_LEPPY|nr:putative thymine-7-hydroxylase [Leptomonas pyrrhocoris]XP_015658728.1 putative thymine-7-hydroxylase [Leptomonas pyrrhocoris]XP_015658729.1 putative thymine-7-hydroxylase [Leptomonas pyrrhocoris]XP_015658730.1 putative thymine-7-hydroxylase [Leptomonas pyrrhocoris]XP_015658731.1 putative thymine-7-hydroxylase [Leptomonas pyrrhocoris]KPA80288.1 putative thymine-7-hydroxylase [Leptomonas pyrrhocoris]KPA80289.1 putative thymine-7-hydroxylase [Leptomonas pyrrhocoris]KPA80290.1 putative thymin|eukprot:XP_015658727.1 putative thymine-7-hydroxylase [Leptomonas pyrrhocoris]
MSLPVIDISPLYNDNKDDLLRVAHAIDDACRTWGFFYITGHGIPKERVAKLTEMADRFFALPEEEKLKIDISKTTNHRGYGTYAAEQLDPSKPGDWKETFDMGCHLPLDHPSVVAGQPLRGPNNHPTSIEGWTELMEQHYADMQKMALQLLRALALAIGIDEGFFVSKFHEPLSVFRMIRYPALPDEKGRVVCGAHTDYGIVTLLYQDKAGGLQVQNLSGEWMDAPPIEGSYVVNIGDMMSMWSNGRYKSTLHRVVNPGVERISMPFFCEPNPETVISCLPNCFDEQHPALFPDVKAGDWLQQRFKRTYAYRAEM